MIMELQERINVLTQGAELAQKNGVLTLNDAYYAKQALDALKNNVSHKEAFEILVKIINQGQKKGVYALRDSYLLYLALDNYDSVIPTVAAPAPSAPVPQTTGKRSTKKGE